MMLVSCVAFCSLATTPAPTPQEMIAKGVAALVEMQEDGEWPYEGVYRVGGQIPIGYRVGGTSIVASALLAAADPSDKAANAAIGEGLDFVLEGLAHPLMQPSTVDAYDVRVWGHCFALEFLCRLRAAKRAGEKEADAATWIPKLVAALLEEEIPGGGWNYATRKQPASFVTAPVIQSLLLAKSQGETVPDAAIERARDILLRQRLESGAFFYSGAPSAGAEVGEGKEGKKSKSSVPASALLPGSIARSPGAEATLLLLGAGSATAAQAALRAFHEHWDELEKRRKKTGTHEGRYAIAPYYFFYGHRYAAQAIEALPPESREKERKRLLAKILETRDADGTWNDRVFPRSRNFGTAMIVLALLGEKSPTVPGWKRE